MKRILLLFLVLPLATVAFAEEDPSAQAMAILKKADAAIKAIDSVRMTASAQPAGMALQWMKPARGTSLMIGWNAGIPQKFHAEVTVVPEGDKPMRLTGGGNGDTYFIIDHKEKKAYEDMDPGVLGSIGSSLQAAAMMEYVHDRPFEDELGAEEMKLLGEEPVGDEPCYKLLVVYTQGQQESVWYFSKNDYLPRRRIQSFTFSGATGTIDRLVTKLEIDPEYDAGLFKLKLPEGYEQIDDFAP